MNRDIIHDIRRYVLSRQSAGLDVAYRLEEPGSAVAQPDGAAPISEREGARPAREAAPSRPVDNGIAMLTSAEQPIRYTRDEQRVSQAGLFAEPETERFDLSGYDLASLERVVASCERCSLCAGRTRTVFGSGNPSSKIVFVGEAPGREEDLQGLPFVGRAGQLLTKILAAMGLKRDDVYITNILKCRPPENRDPQEDEMRACEPYLARQLDLISPAIICALGRIAGHGLLKKGASLSVLRHGVHYYNDIKVAVTYHPAALLRNPNLKRDAWEDFQAVKRLYDEAIGEDA